MQRTLTTLGLILSLLGGCAEGPDIEGAADGAALDFFCTLPDPEACALYDGDEEIDTGVAMDGGLPSDDASTLIPDSGITDGGDGVDASAVGDAGPSTVDNPCDGACETLAPSAPECSDGTPADVVCLPAYLGYCAWHFLCRTP